MKDVSLKVLKKRRSWTVVLAVAAMVLFATFFSEMQYQTTSNPIDVLSIQSNQTGPLARDVLETLSVKGRAPKTDYSRNQFGSGWATVDGCDMRNTILANSLSEVVLDSDECTVLSGVLADPYTATVIAFNRGSGTSGAVQIDHVVALSDAWQKGAQAMEFTERVLFSNDPLNLLAVDGPANQKKGDSDAASWLPSNRAFRCPYVARQIAVKAEYNLWVTAAEKAAMRRTLNGCGEQRVPVGDQ